MVPVMVPATTSVPLRARTPIRTLVRVAPTTLLATLIPSKDEPCDERNECEYDDGLVLHIKGRDIYSSDGRDC